MSELNFKLGASTGEALDAIGRVLAATEKVDEKAQEATEALGEMGSALSESASAAETAATSSTEIASEIDKASKSAAAAAAATASVGGALEDAAAEAHDFSTAVEETADNLDAVQNAANAAASILQQILETDNPLEGFNAALGTFQERIDEATHELNSLQMQMSEGGMSTEEVEAASARYAELTEQITMAQSIYEGLQAAEAQYRASLEESTETTERHNQTFVDLLGGADKYRTILNTLPPGVKAVITEMEGLTTTARAFIATPLGAVLAAITLALSSLTTWFKNSSEGEMAFAEITGYVSGILNQLKEIAISVGKTIYEAFTNPKQAVKDLWSTIKSQLLNRIDGLGKTFKVLGEMIASVFKGEFDADKWAQMGKNLADATAETITGIDKLTDKVNKYAKTTANAAKLTAEYNKREKQLARDRSKWAVEEQEIDNELIRLRSSNMSGGDTKKNQQRAQELVKKKYDQQQAFLTEELKIQQGRMALTTNTDADYERENQLKRALKQIEGRREQEMMRFNRQAFSQTRSAEQAAKHAKALADKQTKSENNITAIITKQEEAQQKAWEALQQHITDARIAAMDEGEEKVLQQLEAQKKKEIQAVRDQQEAYLQNKRNNAKQLFEANPKNTGKVFDYNSVQLNREEQLAFEEYANQVSRKAEKDMADLKRKFEESVRLYASKYGNEEEKREAINDTYQMKIDEGALIDKRLIYREWQEALADLNLDELKKNINWADVFGDLGAVSTKALQELEEQLQDFIDANTDLPIDQYEALGEAIGRVQEQLRKNRNALAEAFGLALPYAQKLKQYEEEQLQAAENHRKQAEALAELQTQQTSQIIGINEELKLAGTDKAVNANTTGVDFTAILEDIKDSVKAENLKKAFAELQKTNVKVDTQKEKTDKAGQTLTTATNHLMAWQKNLTAKLGDFTKTFNLIGSNISALPGLLNEIGIDASSDIGRTATLTAGVANDAMGALSDAMTGNFIGALSKSISAIDGIVEIFDKGNIAAMNKEIEKLRESNQGLASALNDLRGGLEDASFAEALKDADKMYDLLSQQQRNSSLVMIDEARKWEHGSHSIAGQLDKDSGFKGLLNQASALTGQRLESVEELLGLTAQEWKQLRDANTDLYNEILASFRSKENTHTGAGVDELINDYITQYADAFNELQLTITEKFAGFSFDSLKGEFRNALSDLKSGIDDTSKYLENKLRDAVIKSVSDDYTHDLKDFYKQFGEAMQEGLTNDEAAALRLRYQQITNEAIQKRDQALATLGLDANAEAIAASQRSVASMSESTANELNGRFTALQISGQTIADMSAAGLVHLQQMNANLQFSGQAIVDKTAAGLVHLQEMNASLRDAGSSLANINASIIACNGTLNAILEGQRASTAAIGQNMSQVITTLNQKL